LTKTRRKAPAIKNKHLVSLDPHESRVLQANDHGIAYTSVAVRIAKGGICGRCD